MGNNEESLERLEQLNQQKGVELSIAQKQALINEAKRRFGPDWKRMLNLGNVRSGIDWNSIRFRLQGQ